MKVFFVSFFVLVSVIVFGQNATVTGPTQVQPGAWETYSASFTNWHPASIATWFVTGGTIVSSSNSSCTVQWDNINGSGNISVYEDLYSQYGELLVQIGDPFPYIAPDMQYANYGTSPSIYIYFQFQPSVPVTYQWQEWSISTSTWNNLSGQTSDNFQLAAITENKKYRCVVDVNGNTYYLEATVNIPNLTPGVIFYNSVGLIYNSPLTGFFTYPANGGYCISSSYSYTWEKSVDSGPWTELGTGENFPLPATVLLGSTRIRRKIVCGTEEIYSNILTLEPNYLSTDFENRNYIRETSVVKHGVETWQQADQLPVGEKFQSTTYLDGLGRTIQAVEKGISSVSGSPANDIVKHYEYDAAGRALKDFLPFVSTSAIGKFKITAEADQQIFIRSFFSEAANAPTYNVIETDDSPLNRTKKRLLAGQSWAGSNIGVSGEVDFNTAVDDKIHIWTLDYSAGASPLTSVNGIYGDGALIKTISEDEKLKKVITYTDLTGNVILKKVQDKDDAISGLTDDHGGWACTYYVYNDFGQLRYIITPKAVDHLNSNNWQLTASIIDELCYTYDYDKAGRQILKKQPGVKPTYTVYDKKDRVVLYQDGNLRTTNQWTFSLYDDLNRPLATGLLQKFLSVPNDIQASINSLQNDIDGVSDGMAVLTPFVGSGVSETIYADKAVVLCSGCTVNVYNSITEYDRYNYPAVKNFNSTYTLAYFTSTVAYNSSVTNVVPTQKTARTTGFVTGEKIRVLDNDNNPSNDKFLYSTAYYDEQGHSLQSLTDNHKGGVDYSTNQYDFSGKLMSSYLSHQIFGASPFTIIAKNEYDAIGRPTKSLKNFNNSFYKIISEYKYDELGQVKSKTLAPGYNGNNGFEMEKLNYSYNLHGWLTGINKDFALSNDPSSHWDHFFGLYLGYDDNVNFSKKEWNGNITGAIWRSQGDNAVRKYDYAYDNLGRFASATFHQKKDPALGWTSDIDFSSEVQYEDLNGNIKALKHMGIIPGSAVSKIMDNLTYRYKSLSGLTLQGNTLMEVQDGGNLLPGDNGLAGDFKDGSNTLGNDDYDYDDNGNLLKDLNKNIKNGSSTGIVYNFLNKVQKLTLEKTETTEIEYIYDASGEKLGKTVKRLPNTSNNNTTTTTITDYIGDFIYETKAVSPAPSPSPDYTDKLLYVLHEEGRLKIITEIHDFDRDLTSGNSGINLGSGTWGVFEYFIKDNLGNTRLVLTEEEQKEKYYATNETSNTANDLAKQAKLFGAVDANGNPLNNELLQTRVQTNTTPWDGNGNTSTWVNQLTALSPIKKVGPNMLLKVMAGDQISTSARYFFTQLDNSQSTNPVQDAAFSLLNALNGYKGTILGQHNAPAIQGGLSSDASFGNFLSNHGITSPINPNAPRAYLNVVFLDEQFNFIPNANLFGSEQSAAKRVVSANTDDLLSITKKAPKNGWVFVFVNNESNASVYFDDMNVIQEHGAIAEESHYYPFGLKIAGISSKAFNKLDSKFGYQGEYSEEEEETGWNEFALRSYDPQLGRWTGADPYDEFPSPYTGIGNDPLNHVDEDGGTIGGAGALIGAVAGGVAAYLIIKNNPQMANGLKYALGVGLPLLGAGIGYGIFESLSPGTPSRNELANGSKNFWQNFRAFYVGLVGVSTTVGQRDPRYVQHTFASSPDIWGGFELPHITLPKISVQFQMVLPQWRVFNKIDPGGYRLSKRNYSWGGRLWRWLMTGFYPGEVDAPGGVEWPHSMLGLMGYWPATPALRTPHLIWPTYQLLRKFIILKPKIRITWKRD